MFGVIFKFFKGEFLFGFGVEVFGENVGFFVFGVVVGVGVGVLNVDEYF